MAEIIDLSAACFLYLYKFLHLEMNPTKILMCPPDFFDIEYSINPWMNTQNHASKNKYKQWQNLREEIESLGVEVETIVPQKGLPDLVYIDAGVIHKNTFIPSNFKYKERQGERKHYVEWFRKNGFQIMDFPEIFNFEGHGDSLWVGNDKLFCGYGFRTSIEAHFQINKIFQEINGPQNKPEVISIELVDDRFYHLDTCFCPINEKQALYFPEAISSKSEELASEYLELIPVDDADALRFACNSVIIGDDVIIPAGTDSTCDILQSLGYTTHQVEMSEFINGGGACKCLSMPLD